MWGVRIIVDKVNINTSHSQRKRVDIQYLRALSVCMVIIFHARRDFMPNGYLGVDLFFLISGFVLTPQLLNILASTKHRVGKSTLNFLEKRFKRLMPAFLLSTLVCLVLLAIIGSFSHFELAVMQALFSLIFLGNVSANSLSGDYFNANINPFLHFWSLSAEWQLYLFMPFLLSSIVILRGQLKKTKLTIVLVIVFAISLLISTFGWEVHGLLGYYSPIVRIWQFAAGSFIFLIFGKVEVNKFMRFVMRLILILGVMTILFPTPLHRHQANLLVTVVFVSLILSRLQTPNMLGKLLLWTGDRSYSLYLYHLPFIHLALYSPTSGLNTTSRAIGVAFAILLTFIVANFSYKNVEAE